MIFFRRGQKSVDKKGNPVMYDFEQRINNAVFPALQVHICQSLGYSIAYRNSDHILFRVALTIMPSVVWLWHFNRQNNPGLKSTSSR